MPDKKPGKSAILRETSGVWEGDNKEKFWFG